MTATTTRGHGPPVVWIHGYTMDSSLWEPLWNLLPDHRHIGVDLPGHGASGPWPTGSTLSSTAAMVADILDREGATRLVALSFGSMVAIQLVLDRPDLVDRLVLGAPTLAGMPPDPQARNRYRQLTMLHRVFGPGEQLADLWMSSPPDIFTGVQKHPEALARIRDVVVRHQWPELTDGAMHRLSVGRHDSSALSGIRARTLVVVGDEDMPTFTMNAKHLDDAVPDCRVETVIGAGHLPFLELPETTAPFIAKALGLD